MRPLKRVYTFVVLLTLVWALIACEAKYNSVFTGDSADATAVEEVLRIFNIPGKLVASRDVYSVQVPEAFIEESIPVVRALSPFLISRQDEMSSAGMNAMKEYFVPPKSFSNNAKPNEELRKILLDVSTVQAVRCSIRQLEQVSFVCRVLMKPDMVVESVEDVVETLRKELKTPMIVNYVDFDEFFRGVNDRTQKGSFMLLEPFSFHVLKSESWWASFQLILLLAVFLISGFMLGLIAAKIAKGEQIEY